MNINFKKLTSAACALLLAAGAYAQDSWSRIDKDIAKAVSVDTLTQGKFNLIFINKSADFDLNLKKRLEEIFFINYPKQVKLYNKKAMEKVIFVVDPEYDGIAAAGGGVIRFNPEWFKKNPGDVDIVTHETMHLVQAYPNGAGPGWITEGIADYVRYTMGVDNAGAKWSLPELQEGHSYTNAYRITARFMVWIEKNKKKGFVQKLDAAMRSKTYTDDFWKINTGKTVDQLWEEYKQNPNI